MCGIAGVMTADGAPPSARTLETLAVALGHRGPDGEGRYVGGGAGLVQTRLAIIDLQTGDQPLYGPDGAVLVANGEIYNYIELRDGFRGVNFATASDCELPLHTYRSEGAGFAKPLRGMYAVAVYDPGEQTLHLARDPFGIKPLYYAETPQGLVFASEPQAILRTGWVTPKVRREAAVEILQLQFTTGSETVFQGVNRVRPGETLTVRGGRVVERRRLPALPPQGPRLETEEQALKALDAALMDSVSVHQRSDVPYGMFLSGGVDSSVLLACMAELNADPVRAFTAFFPGTDARDEREHARKVARALGAQHEEVEVTAEDFWSHLPAIAAAMDDPAADYAIVPTYKLAAYAARELKVILCGEGGDELFAGYGRYRSVLRPFWLGGRAMRAKGVLDGMNVLRDEGSTHWRDGIVSAESKTPSAYSRLQAAQAVDCADWLPNDLLTKLDRCLMAHALEGRTPLLDPAVADVAFRLPDQLKIVKGQGKYLLRRWLDKRLPEADAFAKKRGFTVPVGAWIAKEAENLAGYVAMQAGVAEICHPEAVRLLFRKAGSGGDKRTANAAWHLLFYAVWHRIHVERADPHASIFDVLGTKL